MQRNIGTFQKQPVKCYIRGFFLQRIFVVGLSTKLSKAGTKSSGIHAND